MLSNIKREMYINDYIEEYEILHISNELIEMKEEILSIDIENVPKLRFASSLEEVKRDSEDFMKSTFSLHNVPVSTIEELSMIIDKIGYISLDDVFMFNELFLKVDPYNIPIVQKESLDFDCGEVETLLLNINSEVALRRMITIFNKIKLPSAITNQTSGILSHEITHTQLNSVKGSTLYYKNSEMLPIFIQLLEQFQKDSSENCLRTALYRRCKHLASDIDYLIDYYEGNVITTKEELCITSKFIESAIKALKLFEVYYYSSFYEQQLIINNIQNIFDGRYNVEELLEKYNITEKPEVKIHQKLWRRS